MLAFLTTMVVTLVVVSLVFFFVFAWAREFTWMMLLDEREYAGRHDKPIWALVFVVLFPLAPFVFQLWRRTREAMKQSDG